MEVNQKGISRKTERLNSAASSTMAIADYVAELNRISQKANCVPKYEDCGSEGPDHAKIFRQRVIFDGKPYPEGRGTYKKEAKQNAAKNVLKCLKENVSHDLIDSSNTETEASTSSSHQTRSTYINYICWLNEYCQKKKLTLKPLESTKPIENNIVHCCSFVVGETEYQEGYGRTKKEAKEEAAKHVHDAINVEGANGNDNSTSSLGQRFQALDISFDMRDTSFTERNYVAELNNYCQKTSRSYTFQEVERRGPPHNLLFFYRVVIGNREYPVAEGKSITKAKKNAAEEAWKFLQDLSESSWEESMKSEESTTGTSALPSRRTPTNFSESVIFRDSSSPSRSQVSNGAAVSQSDPPSSMSTTPSRESPSEATGSDSNSSNDQSTPSRFTADFDSITPLGKGGFGAVYKAREKLLNKYYAVKIVQAKQKALREVKVLSELQHQNIVRYFTCWMETTSYQHNIQADNSQCALNSSTQYLYIKMELCENRTLTRWIREKNQEKLPNPKRNEESLKIAQQILTGVEYIHSKNLIHRDLKPDNIMFTSDETVKIGDFGLVTADTNDDGEDLKRTNTGTLSYMAPEQVKEKKYDRKVDIFALGLIYLELVWKVSTCTERALTFTDARQQKFPKEFASAFPHEKRLIQRMLSTHPEDRPEASDVKIKLQKLAEIHVHDRNVTV
ncbi:interferon-induced, double-stranded RNA-activated protein kinase-like [Echeneis naucrates]|uniref:interferon-induced, double-stranded RNA-activated protein kinase-like n=1 Tax=Echeneis naucrates TaxID=173247 RepID=UPI001113BB90|nr:interferon-induced, double-stranded RNA-activated protein kinase-like [Echeneis naucrates]